MNFDPMTPIWMQVATQLKHDMLSGALPPGGKLPGARELAVTYSINPNTAARVYRELEQEGICETRRGLGTFVTSDSARLETLREEMAAEALRRFLTTLEGIGLTRQNAIDMLKEEANQAGK